MQNNESSMFRNPDDEETICKMLKAFVEEWGPEHVIVKVPTHWTRYRERDTLGKVRLEFSTYETVEIHVECGETRLEYSIRINTSLAI